MKLLRSFHPVIPLIFGVWAGVILLYAGRFDYNFTGFAAIGSRWAAPEFLPADALVARGSRGYDGQFFFYIAQDPLLLRGAWRYLDIPAYRYGRILYPALAGLLALGRLDLLPYTLVLVNIFSSLLGSLFVLGMLKRAGRPPWYAAGYGLLSGLIICGLRDLAEPTALAGLLGGVYFYNISRYRSSAIFFAAGILAREIILAAPLAILAFDSIFRRVGKKAAWVLLAPLPALLWTGYLARRLGAFSWQGGSGNFGPPLEGVIQSVSGLFSLPGRLPSKVFLALFLLIAICSLWLALREVFRRPGGMSAAFLLFSLLPVWATTSIWSEPWSYGRVFLPGAALLFPQFCRTRDRLYLIPIGGHLALTAVGLWWVFAA